MENVISHDLDYLCTTEVSGLAKCLIKVVPKVRGLVWFADLCCDSLLSSPIAFAPPFYLLWND